MTVWLTRTCSGVRKPVCSVAIDRRMTSRSASRSARLATRWVKPAIGSIAFDVPKVKARIDRPVERLIAERLRADRRCADEDRGDVVAVVDRDRLVAHRLQLRDG